MLDAEAVSEKLLSAEEIAKLEAPYAAQPVIGPLNRSDARLPEGRKKKE